MGIREFTVDLIKEAKSNDESDTSKWIRKNPIYGRMALSSPIAGAVSARSGEKAESFGKGLLLDLILSGIGSAVGGSLGNSAKSKLRLGLLGAIPGLAASATISSKWQKKHEKTGPTE